jgi:hypothetical protein
MPIFWQFVVIILSMWQLKGNKEAATGKVSWVMVKEGLQLHSWSWTEFWWTQYLQRRQSMCRMILWCNWCICWWTENPEILQILFEVL